MNTRFSFIAWVAPVIVALLLVPASFAQGTITYQYFYDDLGQLVKVVDSTGIVIEYVYDAVGNILEIKRSSTTPGGLAIFNFTPQQGGPGAVVTIQGKGFSVNPSGNLVMFNGVPATVVFSSTTTLSVRVPAAATTGLISVSVAGVVAVSTRVFTVVQVPFIASIDPKFATLGSTIPNLQVTGLNLGGSIFTFTPAVVPPAVTVGSVSIDPSGNSATLSLTVGSTPGSFVLVGVNGAGSSSTFPSGSNTLTVLDNNSAAFALTPAVSVLRTTSSTVTALSRGVSVRRSSGVVPVLAPQVSVQHAAGSTQQILRTSVSVLTGPMISLASPSQLTKGSSVVITISGSGLAGANAILFISSSGAIDSSIAVSGLSVSPDGTSAAGTVVVGSGSTLGRHIVVVSTPKGLSPAFDTGVNGIVVVQ